MAETEIKSINGKPIADTTARQNKADKTGWDANKYIGTDANGNLVTKDPPQSGIAQENDPTVPAWAKQSEKPSYTADEVGALPASTKIPAKTSEITNDSGYITIAVATLLNYYLKTETYAKTETYSQTEVDNLIFGLDKRLNAIADSEDVDLDQLSEIVAYIKANKSLIDSITTDKVNVADIIDNLTTADSKKPLSAAQGKALKAMYDALPAWAKAANKPTYSKSEVGLGNVDNVRQYSESNPPPYPVTSVNGQTGGVTVTAAGIGAATTGQVEELSEAIADLETDVKRSVKTVNGTAPDESGNVDVIANIETPKIVSSVDEMTDTDKHYVLQSTGTIWAYRTTTTESDTVFVPNFTNLIKFDTNGNPTNVVLNQRYSGSAGAAAGYMTSETGSFAITDTYDISGTPTIYINQKPSGQTRFAFFMEDGTTLHSNGVITISATAWANGENGEFMGVPTTSIDAPKMKFSANMASDALTADSIKDLIVTIDEPITYTEQKTDDEIVGEWYDTGISYAPTFKTDLIGVLGEDNVIYLSDNLPSGTYTLKYGDDNYATVGTISK